MIPFPTENRTCRNIFIYLKPRNIIYLRLHTGDKPYENSQIDKDFAKKKTLIKYRKMYSVESHMDVNIMIRLIK